MDGTHIPILKALLITAIKRGITLQWYRALLIYKACLLMLWPGKVHDARVLANFSFYSKCNASTYLPDWKKNICGTEVPIHILGKPAYP